MPTLNLIEKMACLPSQEKTQVEWLVDRFLTNPLKRGCDCHVFDPKKHNLIIWPSKQDDLMVKFMDQRLIALPRLDKHGAKYWKVREFYEQQASLSDPQLKEPATKSEDSTKWTTSEELVARLVKAQTAPDAISQECSTEECSTSNPKGN